MEENQDKQQSLIENRPTIRQRIRGFIEIVKSRLNKNYILNENSPETLRQNKELILRTIEVNSEYISQIPDSILLEELAQEEFDQNGIIAQMFKKGYRIDENTRPILKTVQAKSAIQYYINHLNGGNGISNVHSRELTETLKNLDPQFYEDKEFMDFVYSVMQSHGSHFDKFAPKELFTTPEITMDYYMSIAQQPNELGNPNYNRLSPNLLKDERFLTSYLTLLTQSKVSPEDIVKSLTISEECKTVFKENPKLFELVLEKVEPQNLDTFFKSFLTEEELQTFFKRDDLGDKFSRIGGLYQKDPSVLETLNPGLLDDKFKFIPEYKMSIFAKQTDTQKKFMALSDFELQLYQRMADFISSKTERWNRSDQNILFNLADGNYKDLINDLYEQAKAGNPITATDIENLSLLLSKNYVVPINTFNITNKNELQHYHEIRELVCDTVLLDPSLQDEALTGPVEKYLEEFKKFPELERMKYALLEKYYGVNYDEAYSLVEQYATDIGNIQPRDGFETCTLENLKAIKAIMEAQDMEQLKRFMELEVISKSKLDFSTFLTEELKEIYERVYREEMFVPTEETKIGTVSYNGTDIPVYDAGTDFSMIVKRVGSGEENAKSIWDKITKTGYDGKEFLRFYTCTSFMRPETLLNKKPRQITLGFGKGIEGYSIDVLADHDVHSSFESTDSIYYNNTGSHFRSPDMLTAETDDLFNELVMSTVKPGKDGRISKLQPDYIVFIKDISETTFEDLEQDPLWVQTKKVASEFGVPIVMIDAEKVREAENRRIHSMAEEIPTNTPFLTKAKIMAGKIKHYIERYGIEDIQDVMPQEKIDALDENITRLEERTRASRELPGYFYERRKRVTPHAEREYVEEQQKRLIESDVLSEDGGR